MNGFEPRTSAIGLSSESHPLPWLHLLTSKLFYRGSMTLVPHQGTHIRSPRSWSPLCWISHDWPFLLRGSVHLQSKELLRVGPQKQDKAKNGCTWYPLQRKAFCGALNKEWWTFEITIECYGTSYKGTSHFSKNGPSPASFCLFSFFLNNLQKANYRLKKSHQLVFRIF